MCASGAHGSGIASLCNLSEFYQNAQPIKQLEEITPKTVNTLNIWQGGDVPNARLQHVPNNLGT